MRTTIELPDSERGTTPRALLLEFLEAHLLGAHAPCAELPQRDRFRTDERGWPVLRR